MDTFQNVRREALFLNFAICADQPFTAKQIREAIAAILRQHHGIDGLPGIAGDVAKVFGDKPEFAVARMQWVIFVVDTVYPPRQRRRNVVIQRRTSVSC